MNFLGFPQSSSSSSVDLTDVKTDILPDVTNLRDIGSVTKRWRNGTFKNVTSDTFVNPTAIGTNVLLANGTTAPMGTATYQDVYDHSVPNSKTTVFSSDVLFNDVSNNLILGIASFPPTVNMPFIASGTVAALKCESALDMRTHDITNGGAMTANSFAIPGGSGAQYLMANGTTLTQSAQPGQSNYYLYNNITNITAPIGGQVTYNNSAQGFAAFVYISHLTREGVDIDVFLASVNVLNDLYIQDETDSTNFIKYNITGPPVPVVTNPGFYSIPVSMITYGGNGNSSFGSNHNILISFFSNTTEINARISTLESDTQNQVAVPATTTFSGAVFANSFAIPGGSGDLYLMANGTTSTPSTNLTQGMPVNSIYGNTIALPTGSRTYWFHAIAPYATKINGLSIYVDSGGADFCHFAIYRSYLKSLVGTNPGNSITLCGQSATGVTLTTGMPFNRVPIVAVAGQNLNFDNGEYLTIAFHTSGSSNVFLGTPVGTLFAKLFYTTIANYSTSSFPASLANTAMSSGFSQRPCFDLY